MLLFFVLEFGSEFVSAVRFCGVSGGGVLRGILPGSLRVLADWAVLFLRRFCRVSACPFFGLGSTFGRTAKQTDAKSHIGGNSFLPQILAKQISISKSRCFGSSLLRLLICVGTLLLRTHRMQIEFGSY